jgi:hypothetical protein
VSLIARPVSLCMATAAAALVICSVAAGAVLFTAPYLYCVLISK